MNRQDKKVLKALDFLYENTIKKVDDLEEQKQVKYTNALPEDIKQFLIKNKYVDFTKENVYDDLRYITVSGNELRLELTKIKTNHDYKWATIIIGIISALAFAKSMGWLDK